MSKYLVTGAAGFIGSRFVESCALRGIETISVDQENHFHDRPEHSGIRFGQIIDRDALKESDLRGLNAVVHLGACTDTTEMNVAYLDRVNTEYSQKLWQYCTRAGIPFVYASSAATYGAGELGYEDDEKLIPQLKPLNPYGDSKQKFDLWALSEERKGAHPPSWSGFKFFNVYGFGERHKGKMSSVVIQAFDQIQREGRARLFRSHRPDIDHGHQKRDFIFVDDVVDVLHFAVTKPLTRGIFNLGSGKARTFLDLTRAVFAALGKKESIEFIDTPVEIRDRYQYFTEATMNRLYEAGYRKPFTSLERGVADYVKVLTSRA